MPADISISLVEKIFSITTHKEFNELALGIFRYQVENNKIYGEYVKAIGKKPPDVKRLEDIPFLPVAFFKTHDVVCGNDGK
jgi:hypothetical protein